MHISSIQRMGALGPVTGYTSKEPVCACRAHAAVASVDSMIYSRANVLYPGWTLWVMEVFAVAHWAPGSGCRKAKGVAV